MLQTWKAKQDHALKKLSSDITVLINQSDVIKATNHEIEKSMSDKNCDYEEIRGKLIEFERKHKKIVACIAGLERKVKKIQHSARGIEIKNVPMPEKESIEDLISLVSKIGTVLKMDIKPANICNVYRLPGKGTIRSIFVEFFTVSLKTDLLLSVRFFNRNCAMAEKMNTKTFGLPGKRQPVYIVEYMPPVTRKLFYQAREFAKENNYLFCWYLNGNIFLRKALGMKQVRIESEQCLNNLKVSKLTEKHT